MNLATVFVPNSGGYGTEGAIDRGNAEGLDSGTYALLPVSAGVTVEAKRWWLCVEGKDTLYLTAHDEKPPTPCVEVWVVKGTVTEETK